jgi:predicted nucleic acid-binding protein
MRLVISDASTLILLTKSELILPLLSKFKIIIPNEVYLEILKGKEKGKQDAYQINYLVEQNKIQIKQPKEETVSLINNLCVLDIGELYAIALAKDLNLSILIDDKKCINTCNLFNIYFLTALQILKLLYKHKFVSKAKALNSLYSLKKNGRYKENEVKIIYDFLKGGYYE